MHFIENVAKTPEGSLPSKTRNIFGPTKDLYGWTKYCLYRLKRLSSTRNFHNSQIKENRILKGQEMHNSIAKNHWKNVIRVSVKRKLETYKTGKLIGGKLCFNFKMTTTVNNRTKINKKSIGWFLEWGRWCIILHLIMTWKIPLLCNSFLGFPENLAYKKLNCLCMYYKTKSPLMFFPKRQKCQGNSLICQLLVLHWIVSVISGISHTKTLWLWYNSYYETYSFLDYKNLGFMVHLEQTYELWNLLAINNLKRTPLGISMWPLA